MCMSLAQWPNELATLQVIHHPATGMVILCMQPVVTVGAAIGKCLALSGGRWLPVPRHSLLQAPMTSNEHGANAGRPAPNT